VDVEPTPDPVEVVRAALVDVERAHAVAVAAVTSAPDLDTALAAVNELAARVRKLSTADDELRTKVVQRVWNAERLTLTELADRVGVSKSRANQLIQSVKKEKEQET
jgi:hypothetical protein